ncbi:MAG: carbon-nitrogen hydrolase family protein [Calditrichaeota bacterium]|nr:carbon-nitrogen hydrolase family protein [Calditrichota bacterium]MCB0270758.1 carbon-nitrogen hydrolase family protein [Calditrichota bacterium]
MKLCIAQTTAAPGDVAINIANHCRWIERAIEHHADLIIFPELSLTGYEPTLAKTLATQPDDTRFNDLQALSNRGTITIGVGMPIQAATGITISMIVFQPETPVENYAKQLLHVDENPYFVRGFGQLFLNVANMTVAPAICYEALQPWHTNTAKRGHADVYAASVAKSASGVAKAARLYPEIAKASSMIVAMANSTGHCDNFTSAGQSAIWNREGVLKGQLGKTDEGLLIYDTVTDAPAKPVA